MYKIRLGTLFAGRVKGWALNQLFPEIPLILDVSIGREIFISGVRADIFRPDLERARVGNGRHGFEIALPNSVFKEKSLDVVVRLSGQQEILLQEQLRVDNPSRGFNADFNFEQFLRWSFNEDRMPYGQVDDIPAILGAVELERMLRIARSESAPQTDLVSVVMPMFNRETIVGEALRSVLDQTYRNFELLIVDDGSTDGSVDVAKSFDDPRIRLIELPQNGGVSAARNAGLRAASGPYIAYLDSDNIWSPHYLACMLDAFRMAPEATTAYAGQEVWEYLPHLDRDEFRFLRVAPFNRSRLERRNFIDLNVFMHRRGCYNELGGFDESMRRLVDWELILRYTAYRPPVFLPVTLCRYRIARADNQITFVEDYVSNLTRLRLRMRLPNLRDADDAPVTPLAVFVHARDAPAFARWRQANRAVVANCRHLAAAWPQGSEGAAGVGPDGEATAFPSVSAALAAHCDGSRALSLLLVNAEYVLSGCWKQVYAAAAREGHFDVLTGRLYKAEMSTRENNSPEDMTPLQIEQYIKISSFSYRMHGNLARKTPYHCLVFTPESVKNLQLSAACSETIQTCLDIFFGTHDGHRQILYSPQISASLIMP